MQTRTTLGSIPPAIPSVMSPLVGRESFQH